MALGMIAAASALAQQRPPINTDRPGYSDSSGIVGKRTLQLETGFVRTYVQGDLSETVGDIALRYGLSDDFELRVNGLTYGFQPLGQENWLDPSFGVKFHLLRPKGSRPEISFEAQTTFPIGASPLRNNNWSPVAKLLYSAPLGKDSYGANLVVQRIGAGDGRVNQESFALTYSHPVSAKTTLTLEYWALDRIARMESGSANIGLAATYLLNNDNQLDLRVATGFNQVRDGWLLQGGYSHRF